MKRWGGMLCAGIAAGLMLQAPAQAQAQSRYAVTEPKKVKSAKQLRDGEGALQLSIRTQKQFIETLIVYFVAVDAEGRDTDRVIRFERGAGVPIMGSNMIDEKQLSYRVPAGRYRPIAFTVACDMMPTSPGLVCGSGFGALYPTGFYASGATVFEVKAGQFTQGGDCIVEYTGPKPPRDQSLFDVKDSPVDWALLWRRGGGNEAGFESLPANQATVPAELQSRITCAARPAGVTLYIPFDC
ncbi:MAG: hypothetical protein ACKO1N_11375 [Erythrobacter sp.]